MFKDVECDKEKKNVNENEMKNGQLKIKKIKLLKTRQVSQKIFSKLKIYI